MGNPVVHFEVVGKDAETLRQFYAQLFDWEMDGDNEANYGLVTRDGNTTPDGIGIGGGVGASLPGSDGHVTFYVEVDDIDAALSQAEKLGGTRLWGPATVADQFELGQFTDPEGHMVGLVRPIA